jgi:putative salt-induced outer membrane protein YdiY
MPTTESALTRSIVFVFITCILATAAFADEVRLKNGDRYTGTVVSLDKGLLKFDTGHGALDVPWADVTAITTTAPVIVTLAAQPSRTVAVATTADGQVTIEGAVVALSDILGIKRVQPPVTITGGADAGILTTGGNTDVNSLRLSGEVVARVHDNRYTTNGLLNHASDNERETAENATGSFRYDRFLNPRLYLNASSIFTHDKFRDLTLRTALGLGVGYQVVDNALAKLGVECGYGYVNENYSTQADNRYHAIRETTSFDLFLMGKRIVPFHRNDAFFGVTGTDNLFVNTRNGVRLSVVGGLVMTIEYDLDYDKSPAAGRKTTDHSTGLTFGYRF